ncbi:hypothetical protein HNW13_018025 [Shewanella sp. BF02_Schw]|uniref:hypothetical protein n=1 Tax=Shewanella sp. BF02_Schw TaxID=394908 RepID=UPI0017853722|nr:hypothetical protein [Shewanella sp. BF02_Schw]MBO1897638.1 hypothetical protein [Shewanella sp. BF02_Schw]
MTIPRKASLRVQLSSSRKDEVAFIEHLNLLRKQKNQDMPDFILKMAMLGMSTSHKPVIESHEVPQNINFSEEQIQMLAKAVAIEMNRMKITDGVSTILAGVEGIADVSNLELQEPEVVDENLSKLKGGQFF